VITTWYYGLALHHDHARREEIAMTDEAQALIAQLLAMLAAQEDRPVLFLHVVYSDGGFDLLSVPKRPPRAQSDTEEAIVAVLRRAEGPLKGSAIARRAGRKYNGHFRERLSRLTADGTLERDEDGYFLPESDETPAPHAGAEEVTGLDEQILGVLRKAEKPLTPEAIARRAGQAVPVTSYFRSRLTLLRGRGVITRLPGGGWWIAARAAPPHDDDTPRTAGPRLTEQQLAARIEAARAARAAQANGHPARP
jgi:hypothetical protein